MYADNAYEISHPHEFNCKYILDDHYQPDDDQNQADFVKQLTNILKESYIFTEKIPNCYAFEIHDIFCDNYNQLINREQLKITLTKQDLETKQLAKDDSKVKDLFDSHINQLRLAPGTARCDFLKNASSFKLLLDRQEQLK